MLQIRKLEVEAAESGLKSRQPGRSSSAWPSARFRARSRGF